MNTRRRLVYYILLNIFVSAVVTGTILLFYHRSYQANCVGGLPNGTAAPGGVRVDIVRVGGAGTVASEVVTIQNNGEQALVLTGWTLEDSAGASFIFPQLTLYPGGKVQVHTKTGTRTAADLYWDRTTPVWQSGELAALYDTGNIARSFYRIP